jgi:aspartate/methionine/tyrosine aminotransferase
MAVRCTQALTQRSRDIILKNFHLAEQFFDKWSSILEWIPPQGSAICFPRVKTPGVDIAKWCEKCVDSCGVLLLPADVYDHEGFCRAGHFRFSLGRENMGECLAVLDKYLASLQPAGA